MTLSQKRQVWLDHLLQCEKEGGGMSAYANQHKLNLKQFYQIKYQLRKEGKYPQDVKLESYPAFSQVVVKQGPPAQLKPKPCELLFSNGFVLRFDPELPREQLKNIVASLQSLQP